MTIVDRFMDKVHKSEDGCWLWLGAVSGNYGVIGIGRRRTEKAHRISYKLFVGPISEGLQVQHGPCHNTLCVNPTHLYLGDNVSNENDKIRDGTVPDFIGENNPRAKLTEAVVTECRRRYAEGEVSYRKLAKEFGVAYPVMRDAITRKTWAHVP